MLNSRNQYVSLYNMVSWYRPPLFSSFRHIFTLPRRLTTMNFNPRDLIPFTPDARDAPLHPISLAKPWCSFPLLSKQTLISPDQSREILPVRHFRFGYPPGQALNFNFTTEVLKVVRPDTGRHKSYSPTSESHTEGYFDLVVKIYPGDGHSQWLDKQPIGTRVTMFGPLPPKQKAKIYSPGSKVVVVALGIGITEAFTTCREELRKNDDRDVSLVHAVRYQDEVVLGNEVQQLEKEFGNRFEVVRVASREHVEGWKHGRVNGKMITEIVGEAERKNVKLLVVGTKKMMKAVWEEWEKWGFEYEKFALVRKRSPPYF